MAKKKKIIRKNKIWSNKGGSLYLSKEEKRIIWNALQEYSFQRPNEKNWQSIKSILTKLDFVAFSGK